MADNGVCENCGASTSGEAAGGGRRNPCPECGSLARGLDLQASIGAGAEVSAKLTHVPYPERLLAVAQDLIAREEFSIAMVVAHMACEIRTEQALSRRRKMSGYNLGNSRVRNLYNVVTGDQIEGQSFWPAFKRAAALRHNVSSIRELLRPKRTPRQQSGLHVLSLHI
jgi:hypothetical protein